MDQSVSIVVTVLGIFLELLVVIGLARLLDARIPKLTILICVIGGILVIVIVAVGVIWGIDRLLIVCLLLALIPGTSAGAYVIWRLVAWFNRRDNPTRHPSDAESRRDG